MKVSLNSFLSFSKELKFDAEIENVQLLPISNENNLLWGNINLEKTIFFPAYDIDSDNFSNKSNSKYQFISFKITSDGKVDFADYEGDGYYGSYYLFSYHELNEFISILKLYDGETTNVNTITFKDFQLDDVLSILIYIPDIWSDKLVPIDELLRILPEAIIKDLIQLISADIYFNDDVFSEQPYISFIESLEKTIEENDINNKLTFYPISEVPILVENYSAMTNCNDLIDFTIKLGIKSKGSFSIQYLLDYLNTVDGEFILKQIHRSLLNNTSFGALKIKAPKDFLSQIIYSSAIRNQIKAYESESILFAKVNIRDIKDVYKSRRKIVRDFINNKNNFKFLDTLSNPLPYNIEKSYRSYLRSAEELDKLTYGSKLYSLILKSIVLYPLEEILYLGLDRDNEITDILALIKNNKPISDGMWIELFSRLHKFISINNDIKLTYFDKFIKEAHNKIIPTLKNMIPSRNDVHHYREHYGEWLKSLDNSLEEILDFLRIQLSDILLLKVINQNYKNDGLYIKAKKIMGYEVDIETVEFKTDLEGKHFIQNELIFYKNNYDYAIPLKNFFIMEFIKIDAIKMGIIGKYKDGIPHFEY